jgi:chromosome segregation ATPase
MAETVDELGEEDVHINEDFLSWMMMDMETKGGGQNGGNGNELSSPETTEKVDEVEGRITGQKRKGTRSRELAKESRMRQRLKQQETEKRIAELRAENIELQTHLQNVTHRTTEVQRQRLDMERVMAEKLRDLAVVGESNRELDEILRKFVDLYADYGSYRQKEVQFYCLVDLSSFIRRPS